jgi:hypothetical protein
MQSCEALELGRKIIAGLEAKDAEAIIAVLADDVVLEVPFPLVAGEDTTGSRRQRGAAVREYLYDSNRRTSEVRFANTKWRTTDDAIAMFQGDGEIVLSDGRPYLNHYLMLFEAAGGKIVRWWEYYNPVIAARAFGAPLETIP